MRGNDENLDTKNMRWNCGVEIQCNQANMNLCNMLNIGIYLGI